MIDCSRLPKFRIFLNFSFLFLGEVVKRIEDVTAELNEKRLKSACKMFREKQNEKFAREQAAKDLNVLYGVVDKSVMTYHQGEFSS
jgi:hypothetical protein